MRLAFRTKLALIVGAAVLSVLAVVAGSMAIGVQQNRALADVENRLVPRLELGPQLSADFERLRRTMQDAVAAQDSATLDACVALENQLLKSVADAAPTLGPAAASGLTGALQEYYQVAFDVSRRLLAGETGERLVDDIATMHSRQERVEQLLGSAVQLDDSELAEAFKVVRGANARADSFRLAIGLTGLVLVLGLSIWLSRGVLRSVRHLSSGFARFATGDFSKPIPADNDDFGDLAREANQMASNLERLAEERNREDWLKAGRAGLSDQLRGELSPARMADQALQYLARELGAVAGTLYLQDQSGTLTACAQYAPASTRGEGEALAAPSFRRGEGLLGQAAVGEDLLVIDDLPKNYLRVTSGLGEAAPKSLALLPLSRRKKSVGVIELAMLTDVSQRVRQLLEVVQEMLTMAFETSISRAALEQLLSETREQAERLTAQEEELRANNSELHMQQEELRVANAELEAQREALRENNRELQKAREGLLDKAQELSRVSSYKSQFLANMSHELRTPLNSMLLLSHLLGENRDGNLTEKQVEHCKTIHAAGEDLLKLINQVLDIAKIEAGRQDVHLETVPVEHFAAHARRRFSEVAHEKGLTLSVDVARDTPATLVTDTQRVERILTNLIGNAIKFTARGSVSLSIGRPGSQVCFDRPELNTSHTVAFAVTDTGIGIARAEHERVFRPFEQLEADSERGYGGTGLGLAIARESALLLGGELHVRSTVGKGSTFTCYLPEQSKGAQSSKDDMGVSTHVATEELPPPIDEAHLLIIEDDRVVAEQMMDIIRARQLCGVIASSGEEGLKLARRAHVAGIILDVRLPDIDGWTVMTRLQRDPETRHIPVHFVSAVDAPERGLALGAVGYLVKPVTHAALIGAISAVTRGSDPAVAKVLIVEDDQTHGKSIADLLQPEQVQVKHVETAQAALKALETERFGCMILDLGLPDMDGFSLLERVKDRFGSRAPRVIVHTGRTLTTQETRQLAAYAETIILKDQRSGERLLEEVRLFVRFLKENLSTHDSRPASTSSISQPGVSLTNIKVLLAEDDMRTVYALSALMHAKGAQVIVAENGQEALHLLDENPDVDGVLMDIMMPMMDGYEAMRRLRRDQRFAALPVIALTAKAMKGERDRCLAAGASDYLAKPVDAERLLEVLGKWLPTKDQSRSVNEQRN